MPKKTNLRLLDEKKVVSIQQQLTPISPDSPAFANNVNSPKFNENSTADGGGGIAALSGVPDFVKKLYR